MKLTFLSGIFDGLYHKKILLKFLGLRLGLQGKYLGKGLKPKPAFLGIIYCLLILDLVFFISCLGLDGFS